MKVSIIKKEITPTVAMYLDGQGSRVGKSQGILDPIYVTALIQEDTHPMIWLSYELIDLQRSFSDEIIDAIAISCQVKKEWIVPSFTHTHSGPCLQLDPYWSFRYAPEETKEYCHYIIKQSVCAVKEALKTLVSCNLYLTKGEIEGCYGNRNGQNYLEDKSIYLSQYRDQNELVVATIVNMSCHPTILGPTNYFISGDLFGRLRMELENVWKSGVFMMQGAAGDMGNRQYRQGEDNEELQRIVACILPQIVSMKKWVKQVWSEVSSKSYQFQFYIDINKGNISKKKEKIEEELITLKKEDKDQKKLLHTIYDWYEIMESLEDTICLNFIGWMFQFGSILYVTIPAELNSNFSLQIKKALDTYTIIIWGYVYYSNGYLVAINEYGNHFESKVSIIPKGKAEEYIHKLIVLLKQWHK